MSVNDAGGRKKGTKKVDVYKWIEKCAGNRMNKSGVSKVGHARKDENDVSLTDELETLIASYRRGWGMT